jgi:general secretion pathway protein D
MRRHAKVAALVLAVALLSGCAAGRAFRRGEDRARVGDWDAAVTYYRQAVQADPDTAEYRIALERAMLNASREHFDTARALEAKDQLDAALLEYRRTVEFDPGNRQAAEKVVQLERIIRDRIEASRPKPPIVALREQAQRASAEPLLNPASRVPFNARFGPGASLRDVLTFIGNASGINVVYDPSFVDRQGGISFTATGTLEQVLNNLLSSNNMFYSVLDEQTIVVAPDTPAARLKYERQVTIMIPVQYADITELTTMLTAITRTTTGTTIPPVIVPMKSNNAIQVRATKPVIDVIRQLVMANDKPRAEITLDVEILEVNRARAKQLGFNLSAYAIGGIFSPEQAPGDTTTSIFNLNTISQGVSTADFYLAVPQAAFRFLETDTRTKVLAQTQLRGAEGTQLLLNIGAREPYLTTTFSPIATGGANINPLSSYSFEQVGISVQSTPRVTDEGDILMELVLKNTALGPSREVGGSPAPSFTNREVTTRLRLRDGESHLLAGLLQDEERRTLRGFPGVVTLPVLKHLFSDTDSNIAQTDIVMLITPRIIRTHQYTAQDLSPIFVGTNQNFGLTGPPPLIAATPETPAPVGPPVQGVPPQGIPVPTAPQGGPPGQVTTPPFTAPPPPQPQASVVQPQGAAPITDPAAQRDLTAPATATTLAPPGQISVTAPTDVRVAAGPYMVPVFVSNVSRASTVTVTVGFNPAVLRVRTISEGSFLRQGGANVVFTPNVDAAIGRIDLTFVRTGDALGANGTGLLAGIQFDAVGTGTSQLTVSGMVTNPTGGTVPVTFVPASVVVR